MPRRSTRRLLALTALSTSAALSLTACLSEGGGGGAGGGGGGGDEIEIMYGFSQEQSDAFEASMTDFLEEEGIDVKFSPTPDFDKLIRSRVAGNNTPDIAIFPQPGITLDIARGGDLVDLTTLDGYEDAVADVVPGIIDAASEDGAAYAAPMSISVKSLVWYPKGPFEEAGYTIPKTHDELLALTDQIREDGTAPWCVGIESQAATGWPATDWMEDYVLRVGGTEGYDQWVKHEIPFNDPIVVEAGQAIEELWFTEGNVLGGREAIASEPFQTAANPMFEDTPECFLHRQASFLAQPGTLPEDVISDLDNQAGVFSLPPMSADDPASVMGGGDLAGLFSDSEDAVKVLMHMIGPDFAGWPDQSGYISPHTSFDLSAQPNETMKTISEIAYSADNFRFDGSDVMPGEVGAGSFWKGMVDWVNGAELEAVLEDIEASWPTS